MELSVGRHRSSGFRSGGFAIRRAKTEQTRSGGFAIRRAKTEQTPFRRICNPTGKDRTNRRQITNLPKQKQKEQTNPFRSTADYKSAETTPVPDIPPRSGGFAIRRAKTEQTDGRLQICRNKMICNPTGKGRINRRQIANLPGQKEQTNPVPDNGRLQICRNKTTGKDRINRRQITNLPKQRRIKIL